MYCEKINYYIVKERYKVTRPTLKYENAFMNQSNSDNMYGTTKWQRRKSVLIRSLFHDVPILSPVEEESEDSPQDYYHPPAQEPFPSPPRPYSPLPPLIIERVPIRNKHDEPEEYYTKLHKRIKKIYVKLFLENRNISSIGSNEGSVNDDELVDNDNVVVDSSDSVKNLKRFLESISPGNGDFDSISNGYGADFESMDTTIKDVENHTTSTEIVANISEEEDSDSECFDRGDIENKDFDNSRSSKHSKSSRARTDDRVPDEELISIIDEDEEDQVMTEIEKSKEIEIEHSYEDEESSNEDIDEQEITEETNKTGNSDGERIDDPELEEDESRHTSINDQEMTNISVSTEPEQTEDKRRDKTDTNSSSRDSETKYKGGEKTASEGGNGDVGTSSSSEDTYYRQITTVALVHFDGSKDVEDRESRVYEDSVRSAILPIRFRRVVGRRVDDEHEVLAELEEDDPKTGPSFYSEEAESATPDIIGEDILAMKTSTPKATEKEFEGSRTQEEEEYVETMRPHQPETYEHEEEDDVDMESSSTHSIEQMRTPRPELSRGTMPVTHQSCSESSCEHTAFDKEVTMLTSSSKDGVEQSNSNLQISNDMNEVLTSIFNESQSNVTPVSARKRKFEEKSVQALPMRVTWEEMRKNFFVGTPKIFRLCDCTDHVCV